MNTITQKLILSALLLMLNAASFAQTFTNNGIKCEVNEGTETVSVIANTPSYSGDIILPETVTNAGTTYTLTSIGDKAFYNCTELISVIIPNSITKIGVYAFYNCIGLTTLKIPNSVTIIEKYAFRSCEGLKSVSLSNSLGSIEAGLFYECKYLTSITIPNSVTRIGSSAFVFCTNLTSVTIPNSVTTIEEQAFAYCSNLTSLMVNWETPLTIGGNIFDGGSYGASLYVPKGKIAAYQAAEGWNFFITIK